MNNVNPNINPVLMDALTAEEAYQLGIIPLNNENLGKSFLAVLSSMPHDEARRAKRKFRKLWRSLARKASYPSAEALVVGADEAHRMGLGNIKPNRVNCSTRKIAVFWELRRRARARASSG